jgi:hypothetical protein
MELIAILYCQKIGLVIAKKSKYPSKGTGKHAYWFR